MILISLIESINRFGNILSFFLERVKFKEKDPKLKRFYFRQYIEEDFIALRQTNYLKVKFDYIMEKIKSYVEYTKMD